MSSKKKSPRANKHPQKSLRKKPANPKESAGQWFETLVNVMARLRAPGGCPWDREQTHATLRTYLIEEAYEVLEALDAHDDSKFSEELGDLLLQVLFHSQLASEQNRFDITDVIREIHEKMIRRHPHVFGEKHAKNSAEVLRNWEIIKAEERRKKGIAVPEKEAHESILHGVPTSLPALLQGFQLTRKAARVGFDWYNVDGIFDKLEEETHELRAALNEGKADHIEDELGDLLFVAVNLARYLKIDPEIALHQANKKFTRRFQQMEKIARDRGTNFAEVPRPDMETFWDEAKRDLHSVAKLK